MRLLNVLENLWQRCLKNWVIITSTVSRPLLLDVELKAIQQASTTGSTQLLIAEREVQHILLGERTSAFAGSGYEFAENRRYVRGDDARFINWRLLARTGQLYRKIFHEERRPQVWLIVDRRNSMRFGTRKRLKVTQGIIFALLQMFRAQQQQMATACVILDESAHWYQPSRSERSLAPSIEHLISAAPPIDTEVPEVSLDLVLRQLNVQLNTGCIIFLISDFHDIDPASMATLNALTQRHTVHACHILDPVEKSLPESGHYNVQQHTDSPVIDLNCADTEFKEQYQQAMQQRLDDVEKYLSNSGVHYQELLTTSDMVEFESQDNDGKQKAH